MIYRDIPAIKVEQPLGTFFIATIKAKDLLEISFSEPLEYKTESGEMKGSQRRISEKRLQEIGKFIDTAEMTFPNTIILSVNHHEDGSLIENDSERWKVKKNNDCYSISFPQGLKSASIIDGQHRVNGFNYSSNSERLNMDIVCSIFFELPNPYQAYLFATINGNQKKVDKGLALEQFGYYIADEPQESWTPEKLAASISRNLNFRNDSPLFGLIKLSPIYNNEEFIDLNKENWIVSTATMMEGILSLISSNYKRDRIEMMNKAIFKGRTRSMVKEYRDSSPLRDLFLKSKDQRIQNIIFNFFEIVKETFWTNIKPDSYIQKTVGIQALFTFLKMWLKTNGIPDLKLPANLFHNSNKIDFSDNYFQASGIGKTRIKNVLLISEGLLNLSDLRNEFDREQIERILQKN